MLPSARGQLLDDGLTVHYFSDSQVWRNVEEPPRSTESVPGQPGVGRIALPFGDGRMIHLHLLLRMDLDTTVGFTEPGVSILGLSRPPISDSHSLGLRLW